MIPITYTLSPSPEVVAQLPALFAAVDWRPRSAEDLALALARSDAALFAVAQERLVGFGRRFSDGAYYSWIVDVIVAPDVQRHGVGREIVTRLAAGNQTPSLSLVASADVAGFYCRVGWRRADSEIFVRDHVPSPPIAP